MTERTGTIAGAEPGIALFATWVGDGQPVVVALHGGPGAGHEYLRPQFDLLARGRTLLFYDQRGGGRSRAPREADLSWRAHVADLADVVEAHAALPATLIGFSWGGLLALLFALEHPDLVSRLVVIGPAPTYPDARRAYTAEFERRQAAPAVAGARAELSRSGLRKRDPEAFWQRAFELSVAGYFSDPSRARLLTPFRMNARVQQAVWESLRGVDLRSRLPAISAETLIVHGRHDPVPLEASETLARVMPRARLVVFEESGHPVYAEETERFVSVVDEFLGDVREVREG